jgi:ribokinase
VSGVALIMVDSRGENLISVAPGANARLSPKDVERASPAIRRADCLLVQLEVPMETVKRALEIARRAGVLTVLNPAPARRLPKSLLRLVDVLTPNRTEISGVLGAKQADPRRAASALRRLGVRCVILTRGKEGALVLDGTETSVPAFKVKPVDAVAAGDVFNGAFAVARTEGKGLIDAVRFACAAAAISVTRKGAQPSVPRRSEIDKFLSDRT